MSNFYSSYLAQELLNEILSSTYELHELNWKSSKKINDELIKSNFGDLHIQEIETISQIGGTETVIKFLTDRGMDSDLDQEIGQKDIAAALYLKIKAGWKNTGIPYGITKGDNLISGSKVQATIFEIYDWSFAIIELDNGDEVILETKTDSSTLPHLIEANGRYFVESQDNNNLVSRNDYRYVTFPQIDINFKRDLDEIIGNVIDGADYELQKAKGQIKLKMNHIGVKLEVAMAAQAVALSYHPDLNWIIDGDYGIHFVRDNMVYCSIFASEGDFKEVTV
jgi:hypothetical protein